MTRPRGGTRTTEPPPSAELRTIPYRNRDGARTMAGMAAPAVLDVAPWDDFPTAACGALEALHGGQRVPVSLRDKPDLYSAAGGGSGFTGTD